MNALKLSVAAVTGPATTVIAPTLRTNVDESGARPPRPRR